MGDNNEEAWMKELSKIEIVRESMVGCQELTDKMMDILQSFEDKLEALDHTMQPILKRTSGLTTRQDNIEITISTVDELIKHVELASMPPHKIPAIEHEYESYLSWLNDVHKGVAYFEKNRKFRKADAALYKLQECLQEGVKECRKEFARRLTLDKTTEKYMGQPYRAKRLLKAERWGSGKKHKHPDHESKTKLEVSYYSHYSHHSDIADTTTIIAPSTRIHSRMPSVVPTTLEPETPRHERKTVKEELGEMIDQVYVKQLGAIANFLYINKDIGYLDKLVTERKEYLSGFLVNCIEKKEFNPLSKHNKEAQHAARYVRGTHQAIFHIHLTLQLVDLESRFLHLLLKEEGSLVDNLYSDHVGKILDVPIEYLVKRWQKVAKDVVYQNPLIVLDMLGEYNKLRDGFLNILGRMLENTAPSRQIQTAKIEGLQKMMSKACGRSFIEYDLHLSKQKEKIIAGVTGLHLTKKVHKGLPADGTVWHGSVKCLNFVLNGLLQYREVLEHPCMMRSSELHHFNGYLKKNKSSSLVGSIILTIIDALRSTLVEISKAYRNRSLSQIFLLNNFHFILKRIRESGLLANDIKNYNFVDRYKKLMDDAQDLYSSSSWDRALEFVSVADSAKILAKCERKGDILIPDRWAKAAIKNKFKEFNEKFAKQYENQSVWSVPDADLRSQIRNRNMERILKQYTTFYETYRKVQFSRNMGKHIKYTPRNLKRMLESILPD